MSELSIPNPSYTPPRVKDLERLLSARDGLLRCGLLDGRDELLLLGHQLLLELLLGLGVQELLPEGDVGEHGGEGAAHLNGRLGAFLRVAEEERGEVRI